VARVLPGAAAAYARIAADTGSAAASERLGSMRLRLGDFPGARRALLEAERRGRRTSVLYDALGVVQARTGEPVAAVASFRRSLVLEPGLEDARRNLAQVLWQLGDRAGAMGVVRAGLALNPGSGDLRSLWSAWTGGGPPGP
jgi:Flp pilus assembly protein TadD